MLLPLLLMHHVLAEIPKQTNYVMEDVEFCPPEGYFFRKEMGKSNHPGPCFLCFCREDNRAICWPRENKRCDVEHYHHHGVGKREVRSRRSPAGLSDIFFRDNLRELFGKNPPENCKPFESSYSIGCPPTDWCIGCTVCDCDANGRWDCHLLSFCPEKAPKKKNMHRGPKGPYGKKRLYRRKNSIGDNSMVKITSTSSNKSKAPKISSVKKQSQKIQLTKSKKSPQVKKNPSSLQPQIKQSVLNKRSSHIVKSPVTRQSKEIKKSKPVQRSQAIGKNVVKKSSPVKNKTIRTGSKKIVKKDAFVKRSHTIKIPIKKTPTAKKPVPVKGQLSAVSEKKNASKKEHATNKYPVKRSPNSKEGISTKTKTLTKKPVTRKLQLTARPVILNSKVIPTKKAYNKTTPIPMTSADIHKAIGHEVVKTFMSAFQRALQKNMPKQRIKRSVSATNFISDRRDNHYKPNRNIDEDFDETLIRVKRNTENITNSSKFTIPLNATTPMNSVYSTEETTEEVNLVSNMPTTTLNTSWNTYYKYSVEDIKENSTEPIKIMYAHLNEPDVQKNNSIKRSVNEGTNDITKAHKSKIVPTKFINHKPSNKLTKSILASTSPMKLTTNDQMFPLNYNEANDLKFDKWSQENLKISEQTLLKALYGNVSTTSQTFLNNSGDSKKLRTSKIIRKIGMPHKKFKLKKVLNTLSNKTKKHEKIKLSSSHLKKLHRKGNSSEFKYYVTHVLNKFNKKNVTKVRNRTSKYKIIKYLQKIFKKMFNHAQKNKSVKHNKTSKITKLNKDSVLESLCESFGPCQINVDVKSKLNSKIDELNIETNRMLVTIKTIKGLLKLIDYAKYDKKLQSTDFKNTKPNFKDDIHILSAILRGTYVQNEKIDTLTQTQLTQMEYIKRNTHIFIQSTSKFAEILNEIIDIIKRSNADMKNNTKRISRSHENLDKKNKDTKRTMSFEKVKDLLVKYNVLQNQFVQKMYQIVSKLEPPVTEKPITVKPLEYKDFDRENRTAAIQVYANNIIRNLRKLKYLAQNLSEKDRRKRDIRDDDSMEYLLVLMEYLLKQNYPLNTYPVNDGIDLLIDAIKQAPDIKMIKKKVLFKDSIRASKATDEKNDVTISTEDSISELNRISKQSNFTSQQDDSKLNLIEESLDESDMDYRKSGLKITTTVDPEDKKEYATTDVIIEEVTQGILDSTEFSENHVTTKSTKHIYPEPFVEELVKDNVSEAINNEEKEGVTVNVIEITGDKIVEDDKNSILSTTTYEIETKSKTPMKTPVTKAQIVFDVDKIRHYDKDDISISRSGDKKYLDWLDKSFEEEFKTEANLTESLKKNTLDVKKSVENISSVSKDSSTVDKKENAEDVMYKKEMSLLNSLDYGLPKSESGNSDSEEMLEDKYEIDTIPSYIS